MKEYDVDQYDFLHTGETTWVRLRRKLSPWFWYALIFIVIRALV